MKKIQTSDSGSSRPVGSTGRIMYSSRAKKYEIGEDVILTNINNEPINIVQVTDVDEESNVIETVVIE